MANIYEQSESQIYISRHRSTSLTGYAQADLSGFAITQQFTASLALHYTALVEKKMIYTVSVLLTYLIGRT